MGIWLHLTHCHLVLKSAAGKLEEGTAWQAAGTLGIQHHVSHKCEASGGTKGKAAKTSLPIPGFQGFLLGALLFPSLLLTWIDWGEKKKKKKSKSYWIQELIFVFSFCSSGNGPPTVLAKGRAARRTSGHLICGSIMKKWRWKILRSQQALTRQEGTLPSRVAKTSHQSVTASQKPSWGAKAPLIQVMPFSLDLGRRAHTEPHRGALCSLFCGPTLPTNLQVTCQ